MIGAFGHSSVPTAQRLERVYVWWAQTPKASRPASKRRAEIRCSVCSSGNAGGLSMAAAEAPSRVVRSFCFFFLPMLTLSESRSSQICQTSAVAGGENPLGEAGR
jgi:hypothetical protein